jgi:hypothetical protein
LGNIRNLTSYFAVFGVFRGGGAPTGRGVFPAGFSHPAAAKSSAATINTNLPETILSVIFLSSNMFCESSTSIKLVVKSVKGVIFCGAGEFDHEPHERHERWRGFGEGGGVCSWGLSFVDSGLISTAKSKKSNKFCGD